MFSAPAIPDAPAGARTTFSVTPGAAGGVALIVVDGPLGEGAVTACRSAVDSVLQLRPGGIVVDLHAATLEDYGVGVLALLRRYVARHGADLVVAAPPPSADAVLRMYHTHGVMTVRSVEAAVAAIEQHRTVPAGTAPGRPPRHRL